MDTSVEAVLALLSRPDDLELLEIVELAAEICHASAAGITILKDGAYHVPVTYGVKPFICPADDTFCQFTMDTDGVFAIEDATREARFATLGWVNGKLAFTKFYGSAPLYTPDGTMIGRLCVIDPEPKVLDETEERALATLARNVTKVIELRLMRRAGAGTEPADDRIGRLAAELSHDLRVPASSVYASVEMLCDELRDYQDASVQTLLRRAMGASQRMVRMLASVMDLVSLRAAPRQPVDLGETARALVEELMPLVEKAGAQVDVGDLPVVEANPDQMYAVLQNLLTNAIKFVRPGVAPRIVVGAERWNITERDRILAAHRVFVRDNGRGIPPGRRDEVFEMFNRQPSEEPDQPGGHGIGLAAVKRVITSLGGSVGIDDVPGGGSEVWFTIPRHTGEIDGSFSWLSGARGASRTPLS